MARIMGDSDTHVYRAVVRFREEIRVWDRNEHGWNVDTSAEDAPIRTWVCGPFSNPGQARAAISREVPNRYGPRRVDAGSTVEVSPLVWEAVQP